MAVLSQVKSSDVSVITSTDEGLKFRKCQAQNGCFVLLSANHVIKGKKVYNDELAQLRVQDSWQTMVGEVHAHEYMRM